MLARRFPEEWEISQGALYVALRRHETMKIVGERSATCRALVSTQVKKNCDAQAA